MMAKVVAESEYIKVPEFHNAVTCPECGAYVIGSKKRFRCSSCGWEWRQYQVDRPSESWRTSDDSWDYSPGYTVYYQSPTTPPIWVSKEVWEAEVHNQSDLQLAVITAAGIEKYLPLLVKHLEECDPETLRYFQGLTKRHGPTHAKRLRAACKYVSRGTVVGTELNDAFQEWAAEHRAHSVPRS